MFTTNSFACYRDLALRSRAWTSNKKYLARLTYLLTPSNWWRSCVPNLRGPLGAKTVTCIWRFSGLRLQHGYQVSPRDITAEVLRHDYQASLRSAIIHPFHPCGILLLAQARPKMPCIYTSLKKKLYPLQSSTPSLTTSSTHTKTTKTLRMDLSWDHFNSSLQVKTHIWPQKQ